MTARKPTRTFVLLIGVAVAAMVIGIVVGRSVRSPAQEALDTAPPEKTVITAPVTEPDSTGTVVTRGTVAVGRTVSIGPVKASTAESVVTGVFVTAGKEVKVGSRIIEVSGRPVFLLRGAFAAYRDLAVGDSGPDAAQVNKALADLGLDAPDGDIFTDASSDALAELYGKAGYEPPDGGGLDRREVVFVSGRTAMVAGVSARVGAPATEPDLVTLLAGETVVNANLDPKAAASDKAGDEATIHLDESGSTVQATVTSVTIGDNLQSTIIALKPSGQIDPDQNGANVRVELTVESTAQAPLSVPVTAVYSQADGQTVVVLVRGAEHVVVPVKVGPIIGGFVGITPLDDTAGLAVGDQVIVSGPGFN